MSLNPSYWSSKHIAQNKLKTLRNSSKISLFMIKELTPSLALNNFKIGGFELICLEFQKLELEFV